MLTKILAGTLAALVVAGTGVYFTYFSGYDCPSGKCQQRTTAPMPVSEGLGCCEKSLPSCCSDAATCTVGETSCSNPLAACVGGMSSVSLTAKAKPGHCCDE